MAVFLELGTGITDEVCPKERCTRTDSFVGKFMLHSNCNTDNSKNAPLKLQQAIGQATCRTAAATGAVTHVYRELLPSVS
jgi:hypothetical protein